MRWDVAWFKLELNLRHLNSMAAPDADPNALYTDEDLGIPPPIKCYSCERTVYFTSRSAFDAKRFTTAGGYDWLDIPWDEIRGTPCIACLEEYLMYTHDMHPVRRN